MASNPDAAPQTDSPTGQDSIEMPRPTAAPLVLSLGVALLAAGVALGTTFMVVGALVLVTGLGLWVAALLPGQGHVHEQRVELALRPTPVTTERERVEQLRPGMPGYRVRLPEDVYPISAGVKGGIIGGLVMPLPALLYGLWSGHGIWYPVNLLAGMVLPGIGNMTEAQLEQFSLSLLLTGLVIHAATAVVIGLIYGVLLPTLPGIPESVAWGGLLMPLLWTGITFSLMEVINPVLRRGVSWPWFIISQFIFGIAAAAVIIQAKKFRPVPAGLLGGAVAGLVMAVPAIVWSVATKHGVWYPVNLLAGMVLPGMRDVSGPELNQFRAPWLVAGLIIHALLSLGFGVVYGVLLPRLPKLSGSLVWGGLLLPLLWTGVSYSLMGVVNPVLQERVDWPWFILSQFVFGAVAAFVVDRSEKIPVPPAGSGLS
jgi:uncharacterized membrane protein YagU involved in acid resistance